MAAINSIRKRTGLVIGIIGVALLGFLISDGLQNNSSLFGQEKPVVGEIDGEEIPKDKYDAHFDQYVKNYKGSASVASLDDKQRMQVNNEAWERLIIEKMVGLELAELGLEVSPDELTYEMVGKSQPHPIIARNFTNPETNQFDLQMYQNFVNSLDRVEQRDRDAWKQIKSAIYLNRKESKYLNLISKSAYVTELEAKYKYLEDNKMATFKYVALKAGESSDSSITVTDEELTAYANAHKERFEQQEGRSIKFVSFRFTPSGADTVEAKQKIEKIKSDFANPKDDFRFARLKSEAPIDTAYKAPSQLPSNLEGQIVGAKKGEIFGPYFEFGKYKVAKVVDIKEGKDRYIRAAQILVKVDGDTEADTTAAYTKAKDILKEIKSGEKSFEDAARRNNTGRNAANGGDLGWFIEGSQKTKINKAIEGKDSGDVFIVQTNEGAHIMQVTRKPTNKTFAVASIERSISPSEATINQAYNNAKDFMYSAKTAQDFVNELANRGLDASNAENLKRTDVSIPGIEEARELVRWAYAQNSVDVVTDKIYKFNDAYVLAMLTEIAVEGEVDIESNRAVIKDEVIKEKKIAQLYEKMKGSYSTDLETLASAVGTTVESGSGAKLSVPFVEGLGSEPKLLGVMFALKEGEVSDVVKGDNGVYVVMVDEFTEVTLPTSFASYKNEKKLTQTVENRAQVKVFSALKELANPVDNRHMHY